MRIRGFEPILEDFRRGTEEPLMPTRAEHGSSTYDIYSVGTTVIQPNETVTVWTDLRAYMLEDERLVLYVHPDLARYNVILLNGYGIDNAYFDHKKNRGNIGLILHNVGTEPVIIGAYEMIAKGVFEKYLHADNDLVMADINIIWDTVDSD